MCDKANIAAALGAAKGLSARMLWSAEGGFPLAELTVRAGLSGRLSDLAGRSVLIVADQLATAAALIDLDGLASRLVLWPPDLPLDLLARVVREASIEVVVSDRPDIASFAPGSQVVRCGSPAPQQQPVHDRARATEWVLFTSGTTGLPKMVVHTFAGLTGAVPTASSAAAVWGTFYDIRRFGGLQILLRAMVGGGSMILSGAGEPAAAYLKRLGAHGATHVSGTPSHWRTLLMNPAARLMAPSYVRLSGEIVDQSILDALAAFYPQARIGHAFASTEAGVAFEVDDARAGFPTKFLGDPDSAIDLKVESGTLRIRSSRTALRYLNDIGLRLHDENGFVDTSDMVEIQDERCRFVGRVGGIINVGGLKVHPEEVETILNRHARVRMSLVRSRRNPITGAIVVADVVADNRTDAFDERAFVRDILEYCREKLPPHKVPTSIRLVESLEVSPSGKLARHG